MNAKSTGNTNGKSEKSVDLCGVVMPISSTLGHDAGHWASLLQLVSRAIDASGLKIKPVWSGSSTDRITSRILSNLFSVPIAICDITDLNANVMLELGMRLASKKPTIVIAEEGSVIPFDIKDFEVILYPQNLSILPMEEFISRLTSDIAEKYESYIDNKYVPFLSDIPDLEVLEISAQEKPFESFVQDRLDALLSRMERMESGVAPIDAQRRSDAFFNPDIKWILEINGPSNEAAFLEREIMKRTGKKSHGLIGGTDGAMNLKYYISARDKHLFDEIIRSFSLSGMDVSLREAQG